MGVIGPQGLGSIRDFSTSEVLVIFSEFREDTYFDGAPGNRHQSALTSLPLKQQHSQQPKVKPRGLYSGFSA